MKNKKQQRRKGESRRRAQGANQKRGGGEKKKKIEGEKGADEIDIETPPGSEEEVVDQQRTKRSKPESEPINHLPTQNLQHLDIPERGGKANQSLQSDQILYRTYHWHHRSNQKDQQYGQ